MHLAEISSQWSHAHGRRHFPRMIVQDIQNLWLTGNGKSAARITDLIDNIAATAADENYRMLDTMSDHVKRAVAALKRAIFISV